MTAQALVKAKLYEVQANGKRAETPLEVQFNPESLKLTRSSTVEGGGNITRQKRQWLGTASMSLSFDLYFDTSEEGSGEPVSVRTRTEPVERFLLPRGEGEKKQAPPRVEFSWGDIVVQGLVEQLTVDFELFAASGVPLRAKMSLTIKEQNQKFQMNEIGSGANQSSAPGGPGLGGGAGAAAASAGRNLLGAPGTSGSGALRRAADAAAPALAGESAADFLARNGQDPAAWRAIADAVPDPSALPPGLEVPFHSALSTAAGLGASGAFAGAEASIEASLGLAGSAAAGLSAGLALSAAGGVSAAIESVAIARTSSAAAESRMAFDIAAPPSAARPPVLPTAPRPLRETGLPTATARERAPAAPDPPVADPRATTYGFGVPLRPTVGGASRERRKALGGRQRLNGGDLVDPTVEWPERGEPPWRRLPPDRARDEADREQRRRYPAHPCGCAGGCHHGTGR